jgi:hypothetical protein
MFVGSIDGFILPRATREAKDAGDFFRRNGWL